MAKTDVTSFTISGTSTVRVNALADAVIDLLASPVALSAMRSAGQTKVAPAAPKTSSKKKKKTS